MPSSNEQNEQNLGKLLREDRAARERRDFIDAELSDAAALFRTVATQIEALLRGQRCDTNTSLSKLDVKRTIELLGEREVLQRKLNDTQEAIRRLRQQAPPSPA